MPLGHPPAPTLRTARGSPTSARAAAARAAAPAPRRSAARSPPTSRGSAERTKRPADDEELDRELAGVYKLLDAVCRGNHPNTYLNSVGYAEVEKGMKDRLGIEVSKLQIKNKWDKLKEDFKAWKKLLLRQTGTGWCPIKGTIVMDDEWWKKARADIPGCGKFRKQGLQNEEELQVCFGSIISIGTDHWSPHIASAEE
ncbi:L10-interacting MYB domain-containing protein-like [Panicum hallii]|uniref:L10-interacting MYB domain-containing protein-like n=1 Tax=Panicum hallii TaxID=206008 RepID=UPI000DF4E300|nr:L10-interacting MYB domain-containing protein-like [Panicum hallii]